MERRVHSKVGIAIIIVGSIFLLTAGAALAASAAKSEAARLPAPTGGRNVATLAISGTISPTQPVTGGVMIPTCIGLFFDVPVSDVVGLRSEGYGWGGIAKAYFMALAGGLSVDEIIEMRQGDMGWGEIAQYFDLHPGNQGRNLGAIISGRGAPTDTLPMAAHRLAERLGADAEDIAEMLNQGVTKGTIIVAHKLAGQFSAITTPEDLVDERLGGARWGQIRKALKTSTSATAGVASTGGGNSQGQGNQGGNKGQGNQGHGKPDDKGNQGGGRGHDKDHGGGSKKN